MAKVLPIETSVTFRKSENRKFSRGSTSKTTDEPRSPDRHRDGHKIPRAVCERASGYRFAAVSRSRGRYRNLDVSCTTKRIEINDICIVHDTIGKSKSNHG